MVTTILGPVSGAFPLNEGWYMKGQTPRKPQYDEAFGDDLRRLSDLTIHEITVHLTELYVGDDRPTCETKWPEKLPPGPRIPWTKVWASVGTDLSDPTEEADWRKLLHRAWSARNRFPKEPNHTCRLGCGNNDESILHMLQCQQAQQLWNAAITFCRQVLGERLPPSTLYAIIFGIGSVPNELMGEASRAFLRHVVGIYYRDMTRVHEEHATFIWERAFLDALRRFRDAVLRRGHTMRRHYVNRFYTNLVGVVSETDRNKYNFLAAISESGQTTLTATFTQAISNAETAADAAFQQHLGNLARRAQGRRAARAARGRGVGVGGRGRGRGRGRGS